MVRSFIAVPLDEKVKEKVLPLLNQLSQFTGKINLVKLENLHFTLKFLGEIEEREIPEIEEKITKIVKSFSPFEIKIKGVSAFPSESFIRVIWLNGDDRLTDLIKLFNLSFPNGRIEEPLAHLTLARVKFVKDKERLKAWLKKNKDLDLGGMLVNKVVLYKSELRKDGPIYTIIKDFPF